uniref:Iroquois-class homeodomain protein domain-containing protein n=1 Tax=Melopsittacus undulatus TaxID=13146 RepID=A0A8V5FGW5_MELUD
MQPGVIAASRDLWLPINWYNRAEPGCNSVQIRRLALFLDNREPLYHVISSVWLSLLLCTPVPDEHQLPDDVLRVQRPDAGRKRGGGPGPGSGVLPGLREPPARHRPARTQLCRRLGGLRWPLRRAPGIWKLRDLRHRGSRLLLLEQFGGEGRERVCACGHRPGGCLLPLRSHPQPVPVRQVRHDGWRDTAEERHPGDNQHAEGLAAGAPQEPLPHQGREDHAGHHHQDDPHPGLHLVRQRPPAAQEGEQDDLAPAEQVFRREAALRGRGGGGGRGLSGRGDEERESRGYPAQTRHLRPRPPARPRGGPGPAAGGGRGQRGAGSDRVSCFCCPFPCPHPAEPTGKEEKELELSDLEDLDAAESESSECELRRPFPHPLPHPLPGSSHPPRAAEPPAKMPQPPAAAGEEEEEEEAAAGRARSCLKPAAEECGPDPLGARQRGCESKMCFQQGQQLLEAKPRIWSLAHTATSLNQAEYPSCMLKRPGGSATAAAVSAPVSVIDRHQDSPVTNLRNWVDGVFHDPLFRHSTLNQALSNTTVSWATTKGAILETGALGRAVGNGANGLKGQLSNLAHHDSNKEFLAFPKSGSKMFCS